MFRNETYTIYHNMILNLCSTVLAAKVYDLIHVMYEIIKIVPTNSFKKAKNGALKRCEFHPFRTTYKILLFSIEDGRVERLMVIKEHMQSEAWLTNFYRKCF